MSKRHGAVLLLAALLTGCQSRPVNVAIGYRVTIIAVDSATEVTGGPSRVVNTVHVRSYADIAPGRSK